MRRGRRSLVDADALDEGPRERPAVAAHYGVQDGCTVRYEMDREGEERADLLAAFVATIEEEITVDDGIETSRHFRISCRLPDGKRLKDALIPASEFEGLSWVLREWGLRALIFPGSSRREHLRTAILLSSRGAKSRTVYTHTGWRNDGGVWKYLYHGGAVGADDVEVRLDPPFDRFTLPPSAEDTTAAIQASLSLLECGPLDITAPLLGAVYAAPLSFILGPDFAVWVVGQTGSLKSELASLAQRHFGPFTRKTLPGSWSSTGNSLEALLTVTKDMLAVIDDFAPQADSQAQREQTKRAEVLLRNVGNQTGRGRLRPDLTQRPVRPPRGLLLCTGEDHPPTPSIVARLVLVEVDRSRLDLSAVTRLQAEGHLLPHAMRAYIEWLAPRMDDLRESLPRELAELVTTSFSSVTLGSHMRAPGGLSTLFLGVKLFADFAMDHDVLTPEQALPMLERARGALLGIGRKQAQASSPPTPGSRFIAALRTLLAQGRLWIRTGDPRVDIERHGPSTEFAGWRDGDVVYLLAEPTRRAVTSFLRATGEPLLVSLPKLNESLAREGYIIGDRADGTRSRSDLPLGGHRVLALSARLLLDLPSGESDPGKRQRLLIPPATAALASPGEASIFRGPAARLTSDRDR